GMLGGPLDLGAVLGRRTAEMHRALSGGTVEDGFGMVRIQSDTLETLVAESLRDTTAHLDRLEDALPTLGEPAKTLARQVLDRRAALEDRVARLGAATPSGGLSRIHGDYHLGQVLVTGNDVRIIDFEGEPVSSLEERRARHAPLRDVAGMLRSFDYAFWSTMRRRAELGADTTMTGEATAEWRRATADAFLAAYREGMAGASVHPDSAEAEQGLLDLYLIRKAAYEVGYELSMRPDWVDIPLRGLLDLAGGGEDLQ
ncbi:MAG: phosphotransferase, partial [Pseudooceanicola nanhaiensis]